MPLNVTMPDGTIVQNVPDGTTKTQLMARYQKAPVTAPTPVQSQAPDSIMGDIQKRVEAVTSAPDLPNYLISSARLGVGTAADLGGRALKSLPYAEDVSRLTGEAAQKVGSLPTMGKATVGDVGKAAVGAATRLAKDKPTIANLLGLVSELPIGAATAKVAGLAVAPATNIAKGLMAPSPEKIRKTAAAEKKGASAKAEAAKGMGVVYDTPTMESLFSNMRGVKNLETPGERRLATKTMALIDDLETQTLGPMVKNKATGEMERDITKASPGSDTLKSLFATDKELSKIAKMGGDDAVAAINAKKILSDTLEQGGIIAGDRDKAVKLIQEYKTEHGRAKLQENLAAAMEGDSAKQIKNKMADIVDSTFFNTYPKDVQRLIRAAAEGKTSGAIFGAIGKLRIPGKLGGLATGIGGAALSAAMGHPGPLMLTGAIGAAEGASRQIAKGTVADILKAIEKNK